MRITAERVRYLKAVSIFSEIPDALLAELATRFRESSYVAGEPIVEKGERLDTLFIIVGGKVRMHREGKSLETLERGGSFGEYAVLVPDAATVHLVVQEDTEVLSLNHEAFRKFIEEHVEAAFNVIQTLCQRLYMPATPPKD